jgi:hypothetical protein
MAQANAKDAGRLPPAVRGRAEEIIGRTDAFCAEHLDAEYAALCGRLVGKLARKRPSPLVQGRPDIWAAAAVYTVGKVNFLFDRTQHPHMTTDELARLTGAGKSTLSAKSRLICDLLRIGPLEPEYCRRELLEHNPLAWMIQVNGVIVDARTMPPEIQDEARRLGLIPDLA